MVMVQVCLASSGKGGLIPTTSRSHRRSCVLLDHASSQGVRGRAPGDKPLSPQWVQTILPGSHRGLDSRVSSGAR